MVTAKQGMVASGLTALVLSSAHMNPSCTRDVLNANPVGYSSVPAYNITRGLDYFLTEGPGAGMAYLSGIAFLGFALGGLINYASNFGKKRDD